AAEQSLLLLLVESRTGIADGQPHPRRLQRRRLQANAAALGELDRVAEQVEQYLAHAAGIAQDPAWHVGGEVFMELQSALVRLRRAERDRLAHQRVQVERLLVELQAVGLDAGQVERIVDQAQQVLAR